MRIYGDNSHNETLELLGDLKVLRQGVRGRAPFVQRRMTPAEKSYSSYYSKEFIPGVDVSHFLELEQGIYRVLQLIVRENRTKFHPLEIRLEEAFDFLELSDEKREVISEELKFFNTSYCWNREAEDSRLYITYFHMLRVALTSLKIGKVFELSKELLRPLFIASALHDIGKVKVYSNPDYANKRYEDYQEAMRNHPVFAVQNLRGRVDDSVLEIIERHHCFQRDAYPNSFTSENNQQSIFLAQLLSIADFYDSASTRANSRTSLSLWDRFRGRELLRSEKVRNLMLEDKGHISIPPGFLSDYPNMGSLINYLFDERVIGKGDVFNPFSEKIA